jgi:hypothetical protein
LHAQHKTDTVNLPGISVPMTSQGLPNQIYVDSTPLLAENIHFHFTRQSDGKDIRLSPGDSGLAGAPRRYLQGPHWNAVLSSPELQIAVLGRSHRDSLIYIVTITVLQDVELKDMTFHIPMNKEIAKYMSGLGLKGGPRPDTVALLWKDEPDRVARAWIGDAHAGLSLLLGTYLPGRPGGLLVTIKGKSMLVNAYSGPVSLKKDRICNYVFVLVPTHKPPKDVHLSE